MTAGDLASAFAGLTTAHVADAVVRLQLPVRQAPAGVRAVTADTRLVGRARPVRHVGSVDVFLEALERSTPGDVLVVDNGGRDDEACVGDLIALEAQQAGLAGIVIWGLHRDSRDLARIGLPVFSAGTLPFGPRRLDPQPADALAWARVGEHVITADDVVLADEDGVIFLPGHRAAELVGVAGRIRDVERHQAAAMADGLTLRDQTRFADYLAAREQRGTTFREHLRSLRAAVEE